MSIGNPYYQDIIYLPDSGSLLYSMEVLEVALVPICLVKYQGDIEVIDDKLNKNINFEGA